MNDGLLQLGKPTVYPARTRASVYEFTMPSGPSDTQTVSAGTYIWTPPANCTWVEFLLIGGGGGSNSGARRAVGVSRSGGGSASTAAQTWTYVPRAWITAPLTIVIGAGGAGGAAVTTDSTAQNFGTSGGSTLVYMNGIVLLSAGGGRSPTTLTGAGSGSDGAFTNVGAAGYVPGSGGATAAGPTAAQIAATSYAPYAPQQGGAGGGANASNVYQAGGSPLIRNGAGLFDYSQHVANLSSGLTTFKSGGDAGNNVAGGNGVDGSSFGAAGGGGGASNNGYASGRGGNGAAGYARVVCL